MSSPNTNSRRPRAAQTREPSALARWLWGLASVIHPFPVIVVVLTSAVLLVIAQRGHVGGVFTARAVGVVLLSQIAVGAYNDYHDRFYDARMQAAKPIPSGRFSPGAAGALAAVAVLLFVPLAASFGWPAFGLASLGLAAGLAYDRWLKPTPWSILGYLIGFLALITWIWYITSSIPAWFPLLYVVGPFVLGAAHLAQSFPDIETDRDLGQHGLAVTLGTEGTFMALLALYVVAFLGALGLSVRFLDYPGIVLEIASFALAVPVARLRSRCIADPAARIGVFYRISIAIGTLVLATVITLSRWA